MFTSILNSDNAPKDTEHKEGELYKTVTAHGKTFELRYGFYEEKDRQNPMCAPSVIYPDFIGVPIYTDEGEPFATMIQDACDKYDGDGPRTTDTTCAECNFFERDEEWIGICKCPSRRLSVQYDEPNTAFTAE